MRWFYVKCLSDLIAWNKCTSTGWRTKNRPAVSYTNVGV